MQLIQRLRDRKGFTLVELIVVIMIIGILAATLLPKVMGAPAKARDASRQADFNAIATAVEMYYADADEYPDGSGATSVITQLVNGGYLKATLTDPSNSSAYKYLYCTASRNGVPLQAFALVTRLESSTSDERNLVVGNNVIVDTSAMSDTVTASAVATASSGTYSYADGECSLAN